MSLKLISGCIQEEGVKERTAEESLDLKGQTDAKIDYFITIAINIWLDICIIKI